MLVESRSVIRNAKSVRGLGIDKASRASYFRFARFNMSALYYLRAWHRLPFSLQANMRLLKMETLAILTSKAWLQSCEQAAKINKKQTNK